MTSRNKAIIITILFIVGAFFLIFISDQDIAKKKVAVGLKAPEFTLTDAINGNRLSSSDLIGKVLFINFWASWCKPCRDELPSIEALHREMSDNDNFRMITIIYNERREIALEYISLNGYTFPVYTDKDGITSRKYGVKGVPETFIIDKKGIIRKYILGPSEWNSPEWKNFIYSLLK